MSHWSGSGGTVATERSADGKPLKAAMGDQNCAQCLTYAQLGAVVGSPEFAFYSGESASVYLTLPAAASTCAQAICAYQSRAPPQA